MYDWLGLLMFAGALLFLSLGYPVAFSLGGVALIFAIIGSVLGVFDPVFFSAMPSRIFGIMSNYTLLAIPYFIFFGFFIDFFEIAFIVIPIFAPGAKALSIDLLWYGVILGANLQTSFLTPPFGFALFYLRAVAPPEIKTTDIYKGVIPFILLQLLVLLLIIIFPALVTFLPSLNKGIN